VTDYLSDPNLPALLRDLSTRVAALERTRTIPVASGTPTGTPSDGAMQGDTAGPYLWLRVGGAWKRTAALV
jgi:hypothetical protein